MPKTDVPHILGLRLTQKNKTQANAQRLKINAPEWFFNFAVAYVNTKGHYNLG